MTQRINFDQLFGGSSKSGKQVDSRKVMTQAEAFVERFKEVVGVDQMHDESNQESLDRLLAASIACAEMLSVLFPSAIALGVEHKSGIHESMLQLHINRTKIVAELLELMTRYTSEAKARDRKRPEGEQERDE